MNRQELVKAVADRADKTQKEVGTILDELAQVITETVASGDKVTLVGFGTFEAAERKARKARNPQNGEKLDIPAKKVPVFDAGKKFKEAVQNG